MALEKAAEIIDLNASREAPGPIEAQSAGDFLAASRRSIGASLASVCAATNIKIEHLEAIEATNTAALPAAAFTIGFVKVYAQFLGLDAEAVAKRFKKDIGAEAAETIAPIHDSIVPSSPHISEGARMVSIFGIIAILIFVFWIVLQITGNSSDREGLQTAADQPVRLGTAQVAAPALRPRNTAPETISAPSGAEVPRAEETNERAALIPNRGVETQTLEAEPTPEAPGSDVSGAVEQSVAAAGSALLESEESASEAAMTEENPEVGIAEVDVPATEPALSTESSDSALLSPIALATDMAAPDEEMFLLPALPVQDVEPLKAPEPAPVPLIVSAKLTRSTAPKYPDQCTRNAAPLESVTIIFDVTTNGRAANARIVQTSNACFDSAAMATIRRWRFNPKTVDGAPRPDIGKQATLNFQG